MYRKLLIASAFVALTFASQPPAAEAGPIRDVIWSFSDWWEKTFLGSGPPEKYVRYQLDAALSQKIGRATIKKFTVLSKLQAGGAYFLCISYELSGKKHVELAVVRKVNGRWATENSCSAESIVPLAKMAVRYPPVVWITGETRDPFITKLQLLHELPDGSTEELAVLPAQDGRFFTILSAAEAGPVNRLHLLAYYGDHFAAGLLPFALDDCSGIRRDDVILP